MPHILRPWPSLPGANYFLRRHGIETFISRLQKLESIDEVTVPGHLTTGATRAQGYPTDQNCLPGSRAHLDLNTVPGASTRLVPNGNMEETLLENLFYDSEVR